MKKNKKVIIITILFAIAAVICPLIYMVFCPKKGASTPKIIEKVSQEELIAPEKFVVWQENKDIQPFFVKKIWDEHKIKSCVECHDSGRKLTQLKGKGVKKAHWHITQAHGKAPLMNCTKCHDQEKVWHFKANEKTFSANMSVKTCAQCHFGEKKDWEMGAHGKRVSGWKKQRAVMHCTQCHDPHQPAIHKRWPSVAPKRTLH